MLRVYGTLRQEFLNLFSYLNHYTYDKLQTTRWQMKLMIICKLLKKFGDKNSFLSLLISFRIAQLINCSMLLSSFEVTKENDYFYFKCFCATTFFFNLKVCSNEQQDKSLWRDLWNMQHNHNLSFPIVLFLFNAQYADFKEIFGQMLNIFKFFQYFPKISW